MKNTLIVIKWICTFMGLAVTQSILLLYLKSHDPNIDIDTVNKISIIIVYVYVISGSTLDLMKSDSNLTK